MDNLAGIANIVTREDMPNNAIAMVKEGGEVVAVWRFDTPREDCPFPNCQLSAGHPPHHCVNRPEDPSDRRYFIVDDTFNVLREI